MKLTYSRTALRHIDTALSYVKERSPSGAANLRDRLLDAAILLKEHPHAGQATNRPNLRRLVLTPYPYVIFYRATDKHIIMRFRHAAQKPLSKY